MKNIFHLPTWFLIIGLPVYWLELYFIKLEGGHTSLLAWGVFLVVGLVAFLKQGVAFSEISCQLVKSFKRENVLIKFILCSGALIGFSILGVAFYASLFPPHLPQEYDVLNYHITLPRQHLIVHSFKHIPWSSADLFLLPIDFALAPYWLATYLPNKIPQFIFLLGLIGVVANITFQISNKNIISVFFLIFAVLGSHGLNIQMGTAMLDIVICYLFFAALDSLLNKKYFFSMTEFAFCFWAKPLFPLQWVVIGFFIGIIFFLVKKCGWDLDISKKVLLDLKENVGRLFFLFILLSLFVAGPFILKSLYHAGTPIYPLAPGLIEINQNIDYESVHWNSIKQKADDFLTTRNSYGHGRSVIDFVKSFWLIAVPEKGVNNAFDYPAGLPYLLCLVPFFYLLLISFKEKKFSSGLVFIVIFCGIWWMGTQQMRFLYIPLVLMFILVFRHEKFCTKVMLLGLFISLCFSSLSMIRAHLPDFQVNRIDVLRSKDKDFLQTPGSGESQFVELKDNDVAYASFAVNVIDNDSVFVLKVK